MIYHVLTVRTGAEFDVGDELIRKHVEPVIPYEIKRWRLGSGTERSTRIALYRGYVFAGFRYQPNWQSIKRVDGILGVLGMDDVPAIIPDAVIEDVKAVSAEVARANAEFALRTIRKQVREGSNARISNGAMASHIARVQKIIGKRAIVEIMGQTRPVSIALAALEAA